METKFDDKRDKSFSKYIMDKHTQEECIGFIDGYEKALKDSKAPEMFEMLFKIMLITEHFSGTFQEFRDRYNSEIEQLLKEATEL